MLTVHSKYLAFVLRSPNGVTPYKRLSAPTCYQFKPYNIYRKLQQQLHQPNQQQHQPEQQQPEPPQQQQPQEEEPQPGQPQPEQPQQTCHQQ